MKAMILAAGYGTRLRPLTLFRPKALVPVGNRPMIEGVIQYLSRFGIGEIMVNAHHQARTLARYLGTKTTGPARLYLSLEEELLGTGGGIKKVEGFWDDGPFVVINADILTDLDLAPAIQAHRETGDLATLILHHHPRFNQILVDGELALREIGTTPQAGRLAFTGIHILNPAILRHIPKNRHVNIIDIYRQLIAQGAPVRGYLSEGHAWRDVGTIQEYGLANRDAAGTARFLVAPGSQVPPSARLEEWVVIGRGVHVGEGVSLRRCVLWDGTRVEEGAIVADAVLTPWGKVPLKGRP